MVLSRWLFFFFFFCWPTYGTSVISRSVTWLFRGSFSSILRSVKIRSIERLHDRIIVKRVSFEGPAWSKIQTATFCTGVLHGRYHRPRMANHWHRELYPVTTNLRAGVQVNSIFSTEFRQAYLTFNPYPTAFPYGNGMVLHFYQQQESSTTKTVHKVINKGLKTYV